MPEEKCPFCGSDKIRLETPYVALNDQGEYAPTKTFCCASQRRNAEYVKKRFSPDDPNKPDPKEVGEW